MAVLNTKSDVLTLHEATTGSRLDRHLYSSTIIKGLATVTQGAAAGDANSTIEFMKIPAGSRLMLIGTRARWSAFGASRVLSFGYRAYYKADGTTQAQSLTALGTALDVSSAGTALLNTLTTPLDSFLFEGETTLVAQVTGGTIPAAAVVALYFELLKG